MLKRIVFTMTLLLTAPVSAERLSVIETSGTFFKNTLEIHAVDDPTISGVTCYYTLPKNSMSLEDPTDGSISCRQVGKLDGSLTSAKDIINASKGLFFKTMHIDRIYDSRRRVLIYVSYTTKTSGNNASHSISVVPVH